MIQKAIQIIEKALENEEEKFIVEQDDLDEEDIKISYEKYYSDNEMRELNKKVEKALLFERVRQGIDFGMFFFERI